MTILNFADNSPEYFLESFVPLIKKRPIVDDFPNGVSDKIFRDKIQSGVCDSVGIICGLPPSFFYCVDVDEQHYKGIAEMVYEAYTQTPFFNDSRIVIESTPSGGAHYWFRCEGAGGNVKLSSREAFDINSGKRRKETFIETRGKGGQFRTYPSQGCDVITDWKYPEGILSSEDFADLIDFFVGFNEWVEEEKKVFIPKQALGDYEVSPFDDYNQKTSVYDLLKEQGWKDAGSRGDKVYLTRPGKNEGISGTVFPEKNIFYCFTSSTEMEPAKVYNATGLALHYKYKSAKDMFADIRSDFGSMSEKASERDAKLWLNKALLEAESGTIPMVPDILHPAVKETLLLRLKKATDGYAYGIFWEETLSKILIDRERLYRVCVKMGYRNFNDNAVKIVVNPHCPKAGERFIVNQRLSSMNKELKLYIQEGLIDIDEDTDTSVSNAIDAFMEKHYKHLVSQLDEIPDSLFLSDTVDVFRRYFKDCWIEVGRDGINVFDYEDLPDGLVPIGKYINFNYKDTKTPETGIFTDYLEKAVWDKDYSLLALSHVIHDYKSGAMPYMVGLVESTADSQSIGGSGKNLLISLVSQLATTHHISGEMLKPDSTMLQSWNGQRVVSIDDLPKKFNYDGLKELISGEVLVKHLFKDIKTYSHTQLPKVIINTNHGVPTMRGDIRRRVRCVEFTDFFNKSGGVAKYYSTKNGGLPVDWMFPPGNTWSLTNSLTEYPKQRNCWDNKEWKHFFVTMFEAMQRYLIGGLELPEEKTTADGWKKNFAHTYGDAELTYMEEKFEDLVGSTMANVAIYNHYVAYCNDSGISPMFRKKERSHLQALREWAKAHGVEIIEGVSVGMGQRGKTFSRTTIVSVAESMTDEDSTPF